MSPDRREVNIQIQPQTEIPRDSRGRIRWAVLKHDPAQIALVIETEVRSVVAKGVQLKHSGLIAAGFSHLSRGIVLYYPEGYRGLRQALDLPVGRKPRNYWAKHEAVEIIQQEARTIYQQEGVISARILIRNNRSDLVNAIRKHYPGGIKQLKGDLGINPGAKAKGYWTMENIRQEAEEFYRQKGGLSRVLLQQAGRTDLEDAIKKYAGGLEVFKKEIGLETQRKPRGYWNVETVFVEAGEFYSQFGELTTEILIQQNRRDLLVAAVNKYPGGLVRLREKLEISSIVQNSVSPNEANEQLRKLLEEPV